MDEFTKRLRKARDEINAAENALGRALYAVDALRRSIDADPTIALPEIWPIDEQENPMYTPFYEWKRALRSAHKGPLDLPPIRRGGPYKFWVPVEPLEDEDLTGSTLRGEMRASPHGPAVGGVFTVSDPVIDADGVATFQLSMTDVETEALPADDDGDGAHTLVFDLLFTPSGGIEELLFGGAVTVFEGITE